MRLAGQFIQNILLMSTLWCGQGSIHSVGLFVYGMGWGSIWGRAYLKKRQYMMSFAHGGVTIAGEVAEVPTTRLSTHVVHLLHKDQSSYMWESG